MYISITQMLTLGVVLHIYIGHFRWVAEVYTLVSVFSNSKLFYII